MWSWDNIQTHWCQINPLSELALEFSPSSPSGSSYYRLPLHESMLEGDSYVH